MAKNTIVMIHDDKVEAWTGIRKFAQEHGLNETSIYRAKQIGQLPLKLSNGAEVHIVKTNEKKSL